MKVKSEWIEKPWSIKAIFDGIDLPNGAKIPYQTEVQKVPYQQINTGQLLTGEVFVDEGDYFEKLTRAGRGLQAKPLEEKIDSISNHIHALIDYPYDDNIENKLNQREIKDFYSKKRTIYPLSKTIDLGYGECAQYAALFAIIGQRAGLKLTINQTPKASLINIVRPDTGKNLYQSIPLGPYSGSHNFISVINQECISVDPTCRLNGINPVHEEIMKQANYSSFLMVAADEKDKDYLASANACLQPTKTKTKLTGTIRPRYLGKDKPTDHWVSRAEFIISGKNTKTTSFRFTSPKITVL